MKNVFFSASELGFFDGDTQLGIMPIDAVQIDLSLYTSLLDDLKSGAHLAVDENGQPVAAYRAAVSVAEMLILAKDELREVRMPMLDALTGIAGRAARTGNDSLAAEADALSEQLLDITDDPALNAATDYESMQAAGVAAYKRIAASASDDLKVVFREITGA